MTDRDPFFRSACVLEAARKAARERLGLEVEPDVWAEINRRLTRLDALRKLARGKEVSEEAKKRKHWQGLTVGGIGPAEYGKLYARSHAAALRRRARRTAVVAGD
jgi:hypothetical protein